MSSRSEIRGGGHAAPSLSRLRVRPEGRPCVYLEPTWVVSEERESALCSGRSSRMGRASVTACSIASSALSAQTQQTIAPILYYAKTPVAGARSARRLPRLEERFSGHCRVVFQALRFISSEAAHSLCWGFVPLGCSCRSFFGVE